MAKIRLGTGGGQLKINHSNERLDCPEADAGILSEQGNRIKMTKSYLSQFSASGFIAFGWLAVPRGTP